VAVNGCVHCARWIGVDHPHAVRPHHPHLIAPDEAKGLFDHIKVLPKRVSKLEVSGKIKDAAIAITFEKNRMTRGTVYVVAVVAGLPPRSAA